jgi:8-oxo-dGTP diphosphatase
MPVEELVGAVIYAREGGEVYLALVHDIFGHWTLSKGKLQPGEAHHDGVKRKAKEETGLAVAVEDQLGENEYIANDSKVSGGKKKRHATYFLAKALLSLAMYSFSPSWSSTATARPVSSLALRFTPS